MKLFEHREFEQAMVRAAERFGVNEQFVEKDYYVTEILRIVADRLGDKAMFKGGTSLSKGWGLIARFSEDIDLFVNPDRYDPRPGKNKMDRNLKELSEAVAEHPALTWLTHEGRTLGGLGREDYFAYRSHFAELPGIRSVVRLEPGIQSGTFPSEVVPITSLVGQFLQEEGAGELADDLVGFDMTLLHFRRTFVEKMFAISRKSRAPRSRGGPSRPRRAPLRRPLRPSRDPQGANHAGVARIHGDPPRLRRQEPRVLREHLPSSRGVVLRC